MRVLKENGKRKLVEELGPYFDIRYTIYEKDDNLHCFHTNDLALAEEQWERTKDAETYKEHRIRMKAEMVDRIDSQPDLDELPFV